MVEGGGRVWGRDVEGVAEEEERDVRSDRSWAPGTGDGFVLAFPRAGVDSGGCRVDGNGALCGHLGEGGHGSSDGGLQDGSMVFIGDVEETEMVEKGVHVKGAEVADGEGKKLNSFRGVEVLDGLKERSVLDLFPFQRFKDL